MRIQRTVPPAATPLGWKAILGGAKGMLGGPKALRRLEEEVRDYFGVHNVFVVSSGRAALALILRALKALSARQEVLIPAYTCYSVPSAVVKAGLRPVLYDVDPRSFDFEPRRLEGAVTSQTLCVVPDHLFGIPADLDRLRSLCDRCGAYLIEDAAQAMGGTYHGRLLGAIGDVGFFSLGRGKNITCGSGGIVVTSSADIARALSREYAFLERPGPVESLKDLLLLLAMAIFIHPLLYWLPAGLPFLSLGRTIFEKDFPMKVLSGVKAGALSGWPRRLEQANRARVEAGAYWKRELPLSHIPPDGVPYLRFPVLMESREARDRLDSLSRKLGLGVSKVYPAPLNEIEEIRPLFEGQSFPQAKRVAETLLALPTHSLLLERDRRKLCAVFRKSLRSPALTGGAASRGPRDPGAPAVVHAHSETNRGA